jgi:hypothetical protein|nr:MAG TPA: hypothetical protein [Caudoviricetes sp.]
MTNAEFDAWMEEVRRTVAKLVDVLDASPVEELSDTQIRDKDGVVHDLTELVKEKCVIDTNVNLYMPVTSQTSFVRYFVSLGGNYYIPRNLAALIRDHADDPDVEITVYKF